MSKKGLIISPYVLHGVFEVDLRKIDSREPLCYAYGELLAMFKKDKEIQELSDLFKKHEKDFGETDIEKMFAALYAGFKEHDPKNPKTKIVKQEKLDATLVKKIKNQPFWLKKSYNVVGKALGKYYFFTPMLIEEPMKEG